MTFFREWGIRDLLLLGASFMWGRIPSLLRCLTVTNRLWCQVPGPDWGKWAALHRHRTAATLIVPRVRQKSYLAMHSLPCSAKHPGIVSPPQCITGACSSSVLCKAWLSFASGASKQPEKRSCPLGRKSSCHLIFCPACVWTSFQCFTSMPL